MRIGFRAVRLSGLVVAGVLISLVALASSGLAQERPKYEVAGFRDARFGMTEQEVHSVLIKAFGVKEADLKTAPNVLEGTTLLTMRLPSLDPGPGPGVLTYIFGHKTRRLIQINVLWGEGGGNKPIDVDSIIAAGSRLQRYFEGFTWRKDTTRIGVPVGENTVVLFAGEDEKKGAVRVLVDGVKYQVKKEGEQQVTSPEPKGPPKLIINYIADRDNPDIATIEPGKF